MKKIHRKIRDELSEVSPSMCLAKWLEVTVHLQNGQTHSCHHPMPHKVPLEEIKKDPSALHNSSLKKLARKEMLNGVRPKECEYCWRIEDTSKKLVSDRILKSAQDMDQLEKISKKSWKASVKPRYLEVSFGNECNFKCAYCSPVVSSSIMAEHKKYGPYKSMPHNATDQLKEAGIYPYQKGEANPYVGAFWEWWPEVRKSLKVFRITGGEPLLNENTFKFLDFLIENPMPKLDLAINSNLGIPKKKFYLFLKKINYILENKLVKKFSLYTSVDTYGKNAEFIRFGLNYEDLMKRARLFLDNTPGEVELNFMCTYNAFSPINFGKFLKDISELKKKYKRPNTANRVQIDTPYLRHPGFLSCYVLTADFIKYMERDLKYMKSFNPMGKKKQFLFSVDEIVKFERILEWMHSLEESEHRQNTRRELSIFLKEYQERKNINFLDYCPEYKTFYDEINKLNENAGTGNVPADV